LKTAFHFPFVCRLLGSEFNVVHSYAAIAIDRLLAMREPGGGPTGAGGAPSAQRFQPTDLASLLQSLLEKLFAAFSFPESGENEYLMRAVMRVIAFVGESGGRQGRVAWAVEGLVSAHLPADHNSWLGSTQLCFFCVCQSLLHDALQARASHPSRPHACSSCRRSC
jgi:hypothetical protein